MHIELLFFAGCPGHGALMARMRELLDEADLDERVREIRVDSDADAVRERFPGSPTLRIDSVDVEPGAGERTDYGVKCRLYRTEQGLVGAPPDEWVLAALSRASRRTRGSTAD
jgi:hypothetical protein